MSVLKKAVIGKSLMSNFIEAKPEEVIIELLGRQGYPHLPGRRLNAPLKEVLQGILAKFPLHPLRKGQNHHGRNQGHHPATGDYGTGASHSGWRPLDQWLAFGGL